MDAVVPRRAVVVARQRRPVLRHVVGVEVLEVDGLQAQQRERLRPQRRPEARREVQPRADGVGDVLDCYVTAAVWAFLFACAFC